MALTPHAFLRGMSSALLLLMLALAELRAGEVRSFEIEAVEAPEALKQFAKQAGVGIVFDALDLRGVRTRKVKGELSPREALERVLAGTRLVFNQDPASGAYAVVKAEPGSASRSAITSQSIPTMQHPRQLPDAPSRPAEPRSRVTRFLSAIAAFALANAGQAADSVTKDETVELSPFTITSTTDRGYQATATLAGTRIKTDLADVGASVTAITKQFLDDTAATNVNELLLYTANTETATGGGNFSGSVDGGDPTAVGFRDASSSVRSPQTATRVRGLDRADLARDLFRSSLPWDSYNVDRVEIVRGANSILFGQGSPGGTINTNVIRPFFKDAYELQFRVDDQSSYRVSFDANVEIVDDRLAFRLAGLSKDQNYRQDPAFEKDDRAFLAGTWRFAPGWSVNAHYEDGRIRANRASPNAPLDAVSFYYDNGAPPDSTPLQSDNPLVNVDGFANRPLLSVPRIFIDYTLARENDGSLTGSSPSDYSIRPDLGANHFTNAAIANGYPRATRQRLFSNGRWETVPNTAPIPPNSLSGFGIFDWKNNSLSGNLGHQDMDFKVYRASLAYVAPADRFGIEFSFDRQERDENLNLGLTTSRNNIIRVDPGLQNLDGSPNPNYHRPVAVLDVRAYEDLVVGKDETWQLNAFFKLDPARDFGWKDSWLGRIVGEQTLTAFASGWKSKTANRSLQLGWEGPNFANIAGNGLTGDRQIGEGGRNAPGFIYLGPRADTLADVRVATIQRAYADYLRPGMAIDMRVWDKQAQNFSTITLDSISYLAGANDQLSDVGTKALVLQSDWLGDHLTTIVGYRRDKTTTTFTTFGALAPTLERDLSQPIASEESGSGEYLSWSVVARVPKAWTRALGTDVSFFYNESENFDPSDVGDLYALGGNIEPVTGTTVDYGVRFATVDSKLDLKVNFFETSLKNERFTGGNVLYSAVFNLDVRFREFVQPGIEQGYVRADDPAVVGYGRPPQTVLDAVGAELQPDGSYAHDNNLRRISDSTNRVSKGTEIELTYNPTSNWTMLFNVARQETVRGNSLPGVQAYIAQRLPDWQKGFALSASYTNVPADAVLPSGLVDQSLYLPGGRYYDRSIAASRYETGLRIPLQSVLDQDGGRSAEQREWRANFVTNYRFARGTRLGGFNIGGAVRWQDRASMGFPLTTNADGQLVFDVKNPYFGPEEINYDAWMGYSRQLFRDRVDWKIQLNFRNLFASDDPLPISKDPLGNSAQYRLPALTTWAITNTFRF